MTILTAPKMETKELADRIDQAIAKHHPGGFNDAKDCPTCLALLQVRSEEMARLSVRGKKYPRKHASVSGVKTAKMLMGII